MPDVMVRMSQCLQHTGALSVIVSLKGCVVSGKLRDRFNDPERTHLCSLPCAPLSKSNAFQVAIIRLL